MDEELRMKKSEGKKKKGVNKEESRYKVGDSVVVKEGTLDPDYYNDIGGWQGRICGIDDSNDDNPMISIEWDSITLKKMPYSVIEDCERDGLTWSMIDLYSTNLRITEPRDKEKEVAEALEMVSEWYNLERFDDSNVESIEDAISTNEQVKEVQAVSKTTGVIIKKKSHTMQMKEHKAVSYLGKETEPDGKLKSYGNTIRIDGHFKGEISAAGTLIVGEEGMIEANIDASCVVISGEIHGNINAAQRVDIQASGRVFGDINAPIVAIDEGGIFEGSCQMPKTKES